MPGLGMHEHTPCRPTVRGTLWPPSGDPTFVVGSRRITVRQGTELVAETETDRRGRFQLDFLKPGPYSLAFQSDTHLAVTELTVRECAAEVANLLLRPR
jgi:hypothetical protein